ncbi:hypothetical protein PCC7418_1662 [Halothece sp. PCC 7418]|uniref:hypothetical protein n=1 Tax=Halothece sp. (strain PCC 7418) TaxID=65093 RepID=UPI0002A07A8E|nr:hypothetical protein [Halothece sp. PCC 7418]AFZ43841.1 hypothetical protein PCC7418_1662 [Halothece sp. PCC 7418]
MKTASNYNSWELIKTAASDPDRLGTPFLEKANELLQREEDQERRGFLMQEIYQLSSQLSISTNELPILKAMTTSELEAYTVQLRQQHSSRSLKKLSAA